MNDYVKQAIMPINNIFSYGFRIIPR